MTELRFSWRSGLDRERVNGTGEFLGHHGMHQPLPLYAPQSGERFADDGDVEMCLARPTGAGVAGVAGRIIVDVQPRRLQSREKFCAEPFGDLTHLIDVSDCSHVNS